MSPVESDPAAEALEVRIPLPELIDRLSVPEAFGRSGPVEVVQTHVSAVFLVGDRAYKVKKPVRLWGFIDYGTVALRRHWCEREVELNRRLTQGIYLGVVPIVREADGCLRVIGEGDVVEHAVEMARLPAGATFLERLEAGVLDEADIDETATLLARFHRDHALSPETAPGPAAIGRVIRKDFPATRAGVPDLFPASVHQGLARRIAKRLFGVRRLLRRRIDQGRLVDGHGDLRLEHVVRHGGRVMAIDCVEFSEFVRFVDGLSDIAFLSMDLFERGRRDLADRLEAAYVEAASEDREAARRLLPLFRSYRAHVRARVDYQTSLAPEIDPAHRRAKELGARSYLALAWTFAREGETPPLIVMRGLSGAGKSVLARAIAPWLGAEVIRSDEVRKELVGLAPTDRVDEAEKTDLYSSAMSRQTYAEVLARGERAIRSGRAAILDATYILERSRRAASDAAQRLGAPFAVVDVTCEPDEARRRLAAREAADMDASDAGVAVYEEQLREDEPITEAERAHTVTWPSGEPPEACIMAVIDCLERATPR